MPRHSEVESLRSGEHRFCLDFVDRSDEDEDNTYAFVWRGTRVSADGFNPRHAYFTFSDLGQILHNFFSREENDALRKEFLKALLNLS